MRLALIVLVIAVLGASLGVAHTWSEFSGVDERFELAAGVVAGDVPPNSPSTSAVLNIDDENTAPKASVVGETSHDFGVLRPEQSKHTEFIVRNDGDGDLLVEKQTVSCGLCVQTTFTKAIVKPGQQVTVEATLTAQKPGPKLSESLELRTNDKQKPVIRFDLLAYVSKAIGASVSRVTLGDFSTDDGTEATFHLYGFASDKFEISDYYMTSAQHKDRFDIKLRDLTADEVKAGQRHAKCGKEVTLTVKPGLPVGPIEQDIVFDAVAREKITIGVPVSGKVTGEIFLIGGSKYSGEKSLLSLGRIASAEGAAVKMQLMVKGEHRDSVEVTVGAQDPKGVLSATVGEKRAIRGGESYLIPVTVEIAKGAPNMNRLGGVDNPLGEITLETTHPTAKQVRLRVRFAVE